MKPRLQFGGAFPACCGDQPDTFHRCSGEEKRKDHTKVQMGFFSQSRMVNGMVCLCTPYRQISIPTWDAMPSIDSPQARWLHPVGSSSHMS